MKRAFTLMEVNLAIFIMAVGVLAMVSLYPLGFREEQQSREDVAAAALADAVLAPIVGALSSTNMYWSKWIDICDGNGGNPKVLPNGNGWFAYCRDTSSYLPVSKNSMVSSSKTVIDKIQQAYSASGGKGNVSSGTDGAVANAQKLNEMGYALVASFGRREDEKGNQVDDYSVITLAFRATRRPAMLFAQPIFYTEVHFQGDPNK